MAGLGVLRRVTIDVRLVDLARPVADCVHRICFDQLGSNALVVVAVELVAVAPRVDEIESPAEVEVHEVTDDEGCAERVVDARGSERAKEMKVSASTLNATPFCCGIIG